MPMSPRLLRPRASGDPDAGRYLAAVESADGQALEPAVRLAVEAFIRGCKQDGIWNAIKAGCVLCGARTLSGALTPLVGAAPTNENFVSGDYDRKTGLIGNASTKRLNANRANNADPQNSKSFGFYVTTAKTSGFVFMGATSPPATGTSQIADSSEFYAFRANSTNAAVSTAGISTTGLVGVSRFSSSQLRWRVGSTTNVVSDTSVTPAADNFFVFDRATNQNPTNMRAAFYWIGEALDLALLDSRVTTLYNAIGAAIP